MSTVPAGPNTTAYDPAGPIATAREWAAFLRRAAWTSRLPVASGAIGIGLWLWMAWASRKGRNWARLVSTVLLGLDTVFLPFVFRLGGSVIWEVFSCLTRLEGGIAVLLLWQPQSNGYFRQPVYPRYR